MSNFPRTLARRASLTAALAVTFAASAVRATAQDGKKLTRSDLLVTSDWLATQLENPKLVLLHVGEKPEPHEPPDQLAHGFWLAKTWARSIRTTTTPSTK